MRFYPAAMRITLEFAGHRVREVNTGRLGLD
jgi:hypothetical protein